MGFAKWLNHFIFNDLCLFNIKKITQAVVYCNFLPFNKLQLNIRIKNHATFIFCDYLATINTCSFLRKHDALFQAFDMINDQPDFPAFGRKGCPR
jgi:hypothetical protein